MEDSDEFQAFGYFREFREFKEFKEDSPQPELFKPIISVNVESPKSLQINKYDYYSERMVIDPYKIMIKQLLSIPLELPQFITINGIGSAIACLFRLIILMI